MQHVFRNRSGNEPLRRQRLSRVGHIARDSLIALAVFGLLVAIVGWNNTPISPVPRSDVLATGTNASQFVHGEPYMPEATAAINAVLSLPQVDTRALLQPTDRSVTVAILASVFAAIIAFNLWFLRHLGRVYASSRPGDGRRGRIEGLRQSRTAPPSQSS